MIKTCMRYFGLNCNVVVTSNRKGTWTKPVDKNTYRINIDPNIKLGKRNRILAHEMAHIWQYEKLGLSVTGDDHYITATYRGKTYHLTEDRYWEFPWEVEARGMEEALLDIYRRRDKEARVICTV